MSEDETITLSKHEVVVDRDWIEGVGKILIEEGRAILGNECIKISTAGMDTCSTCKDAFEEDDLFACEVCGKDICTDCDVGSVDDGWVCPSC